MVDGDFLPTGPVTEDYFADAGRDIPLLIGSNLNEWTGFFAVDRIQVDTVRFLRSCRPPTRTKPI